MSLLVQGVQGIEKVKYKISPETRTRESSDFLTEQVLDHHPSTLRSFYSKFEIVLRKF